MESPSKRHDAIDAVIRSIRTGEHSAAKIAAGHLSPHIAVNANGREITDRDAVVDRITGQWAFTPVLAQGEWSLPTQREGQLGLTAEFPRLGAAPSAYSLEFS